MVPITMRGLENVLLVLIVQSFVNKGILVLGEENVVAIEQGTLQGITLK